MKKLTKLLSFMLSATLASQMISNVKINATKDSISFYDTKSNILDFKSYNEDLDTNHDGNLNVFDVIRANKSMIQEESYTDLKEKVYMLETQIESLYQKLNEKTDAEEGKQLSSNDYTDEEKQKLEGLNNYDDTQIKSEVSAISSALSSKVDEEEGKQLSSNDYTDEEKQKLESLNNYDDTQIKTEVSELSGALSSKVDKEEGKQLSSNDYTDEEKQKLEVLNNYDDTQIKSEVSEISSALSSKVDKEEGKQLSSNDYTDEEKKKLEVLNNYDDTQIKTEVSELSGALSSKVDKEEGKQLSSNDYTDEEKYKLESLNNYDDTQIKSEVSELSGALTNKVDKEEGKQLSSNDYTNEEKQKLESLANYDDTDLKNQIKEINNDLNEIKSTFSMSMFKKISVIGDSYSSGCVFNRTDLSGGEDNYELSWIQNIARRTGSIAENFSQGGFTTEGWIEGENGLKKMVNSDSQDLYIIYLGINDVYCCCGTSDYYTHYEYQIVNKTRGTMCGNLAIIVDAILTKNKHAKVVFIQPCSLYIENETFKYYYERINECIKYVADYYGMPCLSLNDNDYFKSDYYKNNMVENHPSAVSYVGMSVSIQEMIEDILDTEYFSNYPY